ncbi:hypothetical protein [Teredinibacter franksiae]|uniref:hypothetical protein n=1 Tax=Teredinibacter franksiae TaxID=2761453 RepID=UPI0016251F57|nr:hypothetical protein [Teredinibacter franksiae]
MLATHEIAILKYGETRKDARKVAEDALPNYLKGKLNLKGVDSAALAAFTVWQNTPERMVDWDWNFASRYCIRYPKAFDLSVWYGNSLCSLSLGRPTFRGTEMRLDFIEKSPIVNLFSREMFGVSLLAYETYGDLIGAKKIRIMEPANKKLVDYYTSHGGFRYVAARQGNPHYLVRSL